MAKKTGSKPGPKKGWKKRLAAKEARLAAKGVKATYSARSTDAKKRAIQGAKPTAPGAAGRPRATPAPINVPQQMIGEACAVPAPRRCSHEPLVMDGRPVVITVLNLPAEVIALHLCGKCMGVFYTQTAIPAPAPEPVPTPYVQTQPEELAGVVDPALDAQPH